MPQDSQENFGAPLNSPVDMDCQSKTGWKSVKKERLVNILNRINFQDGNIFISFKHPQYDTFVSLPVKPLPCNDDKLEVVFSDEVDKASYRNFESFEYQGFFFCDGLIKTMVGGNIKGVVDNGLILELPEVGYEVGSRAVRRHKCQGVSAQINQSGVALHGMLDDFSGRSFDIDLSGEAAGVVDSLYVDEPVNIVLKDVQGDVLYSETCRIIRLDYEPGRKKLILSPQYLQVRRFKPKEFRSIRQVLLPQPNIVFQHPFTGRKINLRTLDISGFGFAVQEDQENSVLLPGMVIPQATIFFANNFQIRCLAQVIFSLPKVGSKIVKCGLVILDMDVQDQVRLSSVLHQATNEHSYVGANVDMEALWDFFFDTGFIYPEKYVAIQDQRDRFKALYAKLYTENPDVAVSFTYQDKGRIYGHMAMIRFYSKNWLIHHHAAISSARHKAGIVVLEQVGRYINDFHRQASTNMKYVSCYFRPQNKFPNMVFGGVARKLKNPQSCSLDEFAYFRLTRPSLSEIAFPKNMTLEPVRPEDLVNLEYFYKHVSDGLMLKALDLESSLIDADQDLDLRYGELGFKRERRLFALKKKNKLVAIIMATISDFGLNMSDLTNCIHFIVLDEKALKPKEFSTMLAGLSLLYEEESVPVLVFPATYADSNNISYDKKYNFWVLGLDYADNYFEYINKLLKRTRNKVEVA